MGQFGIAQNWLEKYQVFPLQGFDLVNIETENRKCTFTFTEELAFAYKVGKDCVKKYQPQTQNPAFKWGWIGKLTQSKVFWGLSQLPETCTQIVIVEGLKDALALNVHFNAYGIYAVGLDSAAQNIHAQHLAVLKGKVAHPDAIFLCLDNDQTGKKENKTKAEKHGLAYLPYLADFKGAKDMADLCSHFDKYDKATITEWLTNPNHREYPSSYETPIIQSNLTEGFENSEDVNPTTDIAGRLPKNRQEKIHILHQYYMRIGDQYYEKYDFPTDAMGNTIQIYSSRKKETITDDFSKALLKEIPKYKDFCNIPSHTRYQREFGNCYNKYEPLPYKPEKGATPTKTIAFLQRIFGKQYRVYLKYFQLMYNNPYQLLPAVVLISPERGTGKTTYANWIEAIFAKNTAKVNSRLLESKFNAEFLEKGQIIVEEAKINNTVTIEILKSLITEKGQIFTEKKNKDMKKSNFFAKFTFCTNHFDFIKIEAGEDRFWVRKLTPLTQVIPNLDEDLVAEIPAFLAYVLPLDIPEHTQKSRFYFELSAYETEWLHEVIAKTQSHEQQIIHDFIGIYSNNTRH